jgi:hypothetical protein
LIEAAAMRQRTAHLVGSQGKGGFMNSLRRNGLFVLLALVFICASQFAHAQAEINLPPRQDSRSATGVSFKTGAFSLPGSTDLSIGGQGVAGLGLVRTYSSSLSAALAEYTQAQG